MLKRALPFIVTFAVGLLIASFFVSVAPTFKRGKDRCGKRREANYLREENRRLRWENARLRQNGINQADKITTLDEMVPPPAPLTPPSVR